MYDLTENEDFDREEIPTYEVGNLILFKINFALFVSKYTKIYMVNVHRFL